MFHLRQLFGVISYGWVSGQNKTNCTKRSNFPHFSHSCCSLGPAKTVRRTAVLLSGGSEKLNQKRIMGQNWVSKKWDVERKWVGQALSGHTVPQVLAGGFRKKKHINTCSSITVGCNWSPKWLILPQCLKLATRLRRMTGIQQSVLPFLNQASAHWVGYWFGPQPFVPAMKPVWVQSRVKDFHTGNGQSSLTVCQGFLVGRVQFLRSDGRGAGEGVLVSQLSLCKIPLVTHCKGYWKVRDEYIWYVPVVPHKAVAEVSKIGNL